MAVAGALAVLHPSAAAVAMWGPAAWGPAKPLAAQEVEAARRPSVPASVRRDLGTGRYWRASRALEDHLAPLATASMEDRVLLAEAHSGWRNWPGVVEALTAGEPDRAEAPMRYWLLLGRAMSALGDPDRAADALGWFVAMVPRESPEAVAAHSRLVQLQAGRVAPAATVEAVADLRELSPVVAGWTALEAARTLAEAGEAESVWALLALSGGEPAVRRLGWRLPSDAWAARGDTARALAALAEVPTAEDAPSGDTAGPPSRTAVLALEWQYQLALGDTTGAVATMWELLSRTTRGAGATEAALVLWRMDAAGSDPDRYRQLARALGNGREYGTAVRAWEAALGAGATLSEAERTVLARAYNGSRDRNAAVALYRELAVSSNPETAARSLRAWADIRRVQDRHGDMRTLEDRLVERYPAHPEALDVVFFAGDDHHDGGRLAEALDHYRRVVSMSSGADRAGLARMRWAQIHISRDEPAAAAEVFRGYLEEFPDGRRWEEAAFWGADAVIASAGTDSASWAAEALARLQRDSPLSYYALLAAEAPDAPEFAGGLPDGPPVAAPDGWLAEALELLALLEEAGLHEAADFHAASVGRTARSAENSDDLLLQLAVALNAAGRTRDGIELGWELRRRGRPWDRTLARVVFPFPHQDLVTAQAEELGLDPYLVAGLIRQESAFAPSVVSSAGAVGLMQVLPATGEELARRVGPRSFRAEFLRTPELNVHLGATYLARLMERYDGDVPLALSAYNAGPTRANRWRRFPEAEDPLRFTERIPFAETRGYVKNVTRNRALYRWLYGGGGA